MAASSQTTAGCPECHIMGGWHTSECKTGLPVMQPPPAEALQSTSWPWSCPSPLELGRQETQPEIDRLRAWLTAIGNLADVDADERGWMVEHALAGKAAPNG